MRRMSLQIDLFLPRDRMPQMPGFYREITGVSGLKPD